MNSKLNDTNLDERVRDFLGSQADLVAGMAAGESAMAERVGARVLRRHFDQRMILMVAAAILIALSAATAIAVGSGLLKWPWTAEQLTDPLATAQPCDLLSDASMSGALGVVVRGQNHLSYVPGPYRDCVFPGAPFSGWQAIVSLRRQSTSASEARQLTRQLFGDIALQEEELAGHRVYLNGCHQEELPCTPAISIAAEPYFLVIEVNQEGKGDRATLETIARAVIANLPPN